MLRALGAQFAYPGASPVILRADIEISGAGMTALTGANGSGKSTLGKLLAGILKPTAGRIEIDGIDSRRLSLGQVGERLGYLFQEPDRQIFTASVSDELGLIPRLRGVPEERAREHIEEMLSRFDLAHRRDAFPFTLSRGEKQRLALAAIMINRPSFLILDEPTTALDPARKREFAVLLDELLRDGIGVLMISHDRAFVNERADRILLLEGGVLAHDAR